MKQQFVQVAMGVLIIVVSFLVITKIKEAKIKKATGSKPGEATTAPVFADEGSTVIPE
jgi:hypothetical protein